MAGAVTGFVTIGAIIGLAWLLTHTGFLDRSAQTVLTRLSFFVTGPALMVTIMSRTDGTLVEPAVFVATAAGIVLTAALYLAVVTWRWRPGLGHTVIGSMCAAYVNAGNLGLPVASYVLGDPAYVAPVLLLQLGLLQPLALVLLDVDARRGRGRVGWAPGRLIRGVLTNPMTLATVGGITLAALDLQVPALLLHPLSMLGAMAVPGMLIAYGVALRLDRGRSGDQRRAEVVLAGVLKLLVQPAVTLLAARWLGLAGPAALAVTVVAALPTAQNVFTHATRYHRGYDLARATILVTTLGCVPVILLLAVVLG